MAVQSVKKLHAMSFLIGPLGKVSLETGPNYLVEWPTKILQVVQSYCDTCPSPPMWYAHDVCMIQVIKNVRLSN